MQDPWVSSACPWWCIVNEHTHDMSGVCTAACSAHPDFDETWVEVEGFGGRYEVSDEGRFRSMQHKGGALRSHPLLLTPSTSGGIAMVNVVREDRVKGPSFLWHGRYSVCSRGQPEPGQRALHTDGDYLNNRLVNLQWASSAQIEAHKRGTRAR